MAPKAYSSFRFPKKNKDYKVRKSNSIVLNSSDAVITEKAMGLFSHSYDFTKTKDSLRGKTLVTRLPVDTKEPNSRVWIRADNPPPTPFEDCETIDQVMRKAIKMHGNKQTMGVRKIMKKDSVEKKKALSKELTWTTYIELDAKLDTLVQGFLSSGIKSGDRVVIFMETRLEWYLTYQALLRMGATVATLYATLGDEGVIHGMNEVQATHVITSNELLPKISKLSSNLKYLKALVVVRDEVDGKREDYSVKEMKGLEMISFEDLEKTNNNSLPFTSPTKDDIALLMYTSGSTGAPKAVVHTHASMIGALKYMCTYFTQQNFSPDGRYICYLPLAHIMENYCSFTFLSLGRPFAFGSPYTLLASSPGLMAGSICDCVVVKPEVLVGVPLMFDRIRKTVESVVSAKGSLFNYVFHSVMAYKRKQNNAGNSTPLVDRVFVNKTRALFGGNLTTIVSGGAALSPDTQAFIQSCLGIDVLIVYGATEVGGATIMHKKDPSLGTTGIPLTHTLIKLVDWEEGGYRVTDHPHPRGEVVIGGPAVASGYYLNEEATKECFFTDCNGIKWWSSGDIAEMLPDGTMKIVDRKKDLVKLSFGEYISLGKVEAHIKSAPVVDNICVYGTGNKDFLLAFVVPNMAVLQDMAKKVGIKDVTDFEKICLNEQVLAAATEQITSYGQKSGLLRYEIPRKVKLCHETWTPDSGLVTAALKIRRRQIYDFYAKDIEIMMK